MHVSRETALVGCYITPEACHQTDARNSFLEALEKQVMSKFPNVALIGDFNAASGTSNRAALDEWAAGHMLSLITPRGLETHMFHLQNNGGTDIDLLYARNLDVTFLRSDPREWGHATVYYQLQTLKPQTIPKMKPRLNWGALRGDSFNTFNQEVTEGIIRYGHLPDTALIRAAKKVLGYVSVTEKSPTLRIPWKARKRIRRLRRQIKELPKDDPGRSDLKREINRIFFQLRTRRWRAKLKMVTGDKIPRDVWKMTAAVMKKGTILSNQCGFADEQIAEAFEPLYSNNRTYRSEWGQIYTEVAHNEYLFLDSLFTPMEVADRIRSLSSGKAPGTDGITHDVYKSMVNNLVFVGALTDLFNGFLMNGYYEKTISRLVLIPKPKQSAEVTTSHRALNILPTCRKLLESLVLDRIRMLPEVIADNQFGYVRGRSPQDCLLRFVVAFDHANKYDNRLEVRSYDLSNAFDRIPKKFVGYKLQSHVSRFTPSLGNLANQLATSPVEAQVGDSCAFMLDTGVVQGGILSPYAYVLADNDLSLSLRNKGYKIDDMDLTLSRLADDNSILSSTTQQAEHAEAILTHHYEYWGGKLNSSKTQKLVLNGGINDPKDPIRILGVKFGVTGPTNDADLNFFLAKGSWLRAFGKAQGLTPLQLLQLARVYLFGAIQYSVHIVLPDLQVLGMGWLRLVCTTALNAHRQTHRFSIFYDIGCLTSPIWWSMVRVIKYYRSAWKRAEARKILYVTETHDLDVLRRINFFLTPSGITWDDLRGDVPLKTLLNVAQTNYVGWCKFHLTLETQRLGLDPCPDSIPLQPMKYLGHHRAKYGFAFRQDHFGLPQGKAGVCPFCMLDSCDTGAHLCLECSQVPVERPPPILALPADLQRRAWRLEDDMLKYHSMAMLWMQSVWKARKRARADRGLTDTPESDVQRRRTQFLDMILPDASLSHTISGFYIPPTHRNTARSQNIDADNNVSDVEMAEPDDHRRLGKWTEVEDMALETLIHEGLLQNEAAIREKLPQRSREQIRKRLRTKRFLSIHTTQRSRNNWTRNELLALEEMINNEPDSCISQYLAMLPGRSAKAIREKLRNLKLQRNGNRLIIVT
jgi:hypothetical protein